jgi:hypothetical protein
MSSGISRTFGLRPAPTWVKVETKRGSFIITYRVLCDYYEEVAIKPLPPPPPAAVKGMEVLR